MKNSVFNHIVIKNNTILIFNTKTQALIEFDQETLEKYNHNELNDEDKRTLQKYGFMVEDDTNELMQLQQKRKEYVENKKALDLTVMVTDACNFRCPYCYQLHSIHNMTTEAADSLKKFIVKKKDSDISEINIHWFGGEPLLNTQPIFEIEDILLREGYRGKSSITTNGYLITDDLLRRIKEKTRIHTLQITLDGIKEQHDKTRILSSGKGTYDTIVKNIKKTTEHGINVIIRINLTKQNKDLDQFLKSIKEMNLDEKRYTIHFTNAHDFDNSVQIDNFYFESPIEYSSAYAAAQDSFMKENRVFPINAVKKCGCKFEASNTFLVGFDLKLYFCSSCECTDFFEQGHICSDGTLFLNNNYKKRFEYSPFDDEECMNCLVLPMCMGGCTYCHLKGKKFCIPEKFVLDDFIVRLYNQKMNRR